MRCPINNPFTHGITEAMPATLRGASLVKLADTFALAGRCAP